MFGHDRSLSDELNDPNHADLIKSLEARIEPLSDRTAYTREEMRLAGELNESIMGFLRAYCDGGDTGNWSAALRLIPGLLEKLDNVARHIVTEKSLGGLTECGLLVSRVRPHLAAIDLEATYRNCPIARGIVHELDGLTRIYEQGVGQVLKPAA